MGVVESCCNISLQVRTTWLVRFGGEFKVVDSRILCNNYMLSGDRRTLKLSAPPSFIAATLDSDTTESKPQSSSFSYTLERPSVIEDTYVDRVYGGDTHRIHLPTTILYPNKCGNKYMSTQNGD